MSTTVRATIDEYAFGRVFIALAVIGSGLQQAISGKFVRIVPALPTWVPAISFWAVIIGIVLIVIGGALLANRCLRLAAICLAGLILLAVVFLHLPEIAADPMHGFRWTNPLKALALFGGALVIAGWAGASAVTTSRNNNLIRTWAPRVLLAAFLVVCGLQHFAYTDFAAQLIPVWIPGHVAWTYFSGVALILGGVGLLVPATSRWAALLSGVMILLWVFLLHLPRAFADLHQAGELSGVFEALALSGVALVNAPFRSSAAPRV
ncbi:MAG: hypothetical protein ABIZ04_16255 [Opitutus sp.]